METVVENKTKNWILTAKDDSISNQLIEAYITGKRDGVEQQQKLVHAKLMENIDKSGYITQGILNTLKENNFNPIDAYLRVNSFVNFDIMITIPECEYIKEEFLDMYDIVSDTEDRNSDEYYGVFLSFCSINKYFDELHVSSDGYLLKMSEK